MAKLLLENGADPNICDNVEKIPPFFLVLDRKNISLMKCMLEHGADPNAKLTSRKIKNNANYLLCQLLFKEGWSSHEIIEILKLLLKHKANPNACTEEGCSPVLALMVNNSLAEETKLECLNLLLKHNADVNLSSSLGLTPFQVSIDKNEFLIAKALLDAGADIHQKTAVLNDSLLNVACLNKNVKAVDFLITNGANVNEGGKGDTPPLWCAFPDKYKDLEASLACINLLLKAGADKNNPVVLQEAQKSSFSEIRELFINDEGKDDNKNIASEKIQKPAVLQNISSGNIEAGKRSMAKIKEAAQKTEGDDKAVLEDLASTITTLYSTKKVAAAVRQQNAKDEKQISNLEGWAVSCMTPSTLTGRTNPSGAANARRKARILEGAIQQRNADIQNKLNAIAETARELESKLRENGREKDADMLKKSASYFLKDIPANNF